MISQKASLTACSAGYREWKEILRWIFRNNPLSRAIETGMLRVASYLIPILMAVYSHAQPTQDALVKTQLLCDTAQIKPGEPFRLGVLFQIEPLWHIYWTNPGDAGSPTKVKFDAPEGFSVEPLEYPVPIKFSQAGNITGYGYTDEVLLVAKVTPPAKLQLGTKATFSANASWLVCNDVCIPGKESISIDLPVAEQASPVNQRLFQTWNLRVPSDKSPDVESIEPSASAVAATIKWAGPVTNVELFPHSSEAIVVRSIEINNGDGATTLKMTAELLPGQKLKQQTLPAVVGYTNQKGERRGFQIDFPLDALSSQTSK